MNARPSKQEHKDTEANLYEDGPVVGKGAVDETRGKDHK